MAVANPKPADATAIRDGRARNRRFGADSLPGVPAFEAAGAEAYVFTFG